MEIHFAVIVAVLLMFILMLPAAYLMGKSTTAEKMTCCRLKYQKDLPSPMFNVFGQPIPTFVGIFK